MTEEKEKTLYLLTTRGAGTTKVRTYGETLKNPGQLKNTSLMAIYY